jgi:hypothetical protein
MLTWTDCPARTPEEQIIFAQREILRRLARKAERDDAAASWSSFLLSRP